MKKITKIKEKAKEKGIIRGGMTIAEVVSRFPETVDVLMAHGMSCIGCPIAMQETLEQGAKVHGIEPKKLLEELNAKIKKKK